MVNTVPKSHHPTNKIAAGISSNSVITLSANIKPQRLRFFEEGTRFGGASGYLHAETSCIFLTPKTDGANLYVTDPFCPNCAKNIAEAGIKNIFVDHKGFAKDFAKRRGGDFENMSMKICDAAGINIYEVHRKDKWIIPILVHPTDFLAKQDNPVETSQTQIDSHKEFKAYIKMVMDRRDFDYPYAIGYGQGHILLVQQHLSIGYVQNSVDSNILQPKNKYSYYLEPLNRLLISARRYGLALDMNYLFVSQHPTPREIINAIGAGTVNIWVGDMTKSRDETGAQAYELLRKHKIIEIKSLD